MGHAGCRVPCGDCRYRSSIGEQTSGEPQRCPPARYALCTSTSVRNAPPHDCNDHITRPSPQHDGAMGLSLRWSHSGPAMMTSTSLPSLPHRLPPSFLHFTHHALASRTRSTRSLSPHSVNRNARVVLGPLGPPCFSIGIHGHQCCCPPRCHPTSPSPSPLRPRACAPRRGTRRLGASR